MNLIIILALIGLATFGLRAAFPLLGRRWTLPPGFNRALRLVPPAVLCALVTTALFLPDGPPVRLTFNNRLMAGLIAGGLALALRKVKRLLPYLLLVTVGAGMVSLWLLQHIP